MPKGRVLSKSVEKDFSYFYSWFSGIFYWNKAHMYFFDKNKWGLVLVSTTNKGAHCFQNIQSSVYSWEMFKGLYKHCFWGLHGQHFRSKFFELQFCVFSLLQLIRQGFFDNSRTISLRIFIMKWQMSLLDISLSNVSKQNHISSSAATHSI